MSTHTRSTFGSRRRTSSLMICEIQLLLVRRENIYSPGITMFDHISLLLSQLYWLKAPGRRSLFWCNNVNMYLCDEQRWPADTEARQLLHRSASSTFLALQCTRLSTVGDTMFPVASARLWNGLPLHVTAASSHSTFCFCLQSHLFSLSFSYPNFWLFSLFFHLFSGHTVTWHSEHCNHFILQSVVCTKGTYAIDIYFTCLLLTYKYDIWSKWELKWTWASTASRLMLLGLHEQTELQHWQRAIIQPVSTSHRPHTPHNTDSPSCPANTQTSTYLRRLKE